MKAFTPHRRLILASTTSLIAAAVAVSAFALPVQAADGNGSPSGTVTVSPAEGLWSDGVNGKPVVMKTSLKCAPADGSYPAGSTVSPMSAYLLAQVGKESPVISKTIEMKTNTDFSAFKDDFLALANGYINPTAADGTPQDADQYAFPGFATADGQSWQLPEGTPVSDFATIVQPNSTYSLVAVCFYKILLGGGTTQFVFEPDSTGHLQSAWSTVTTGAGTGDQLDWKVTPVTLPTSTASPTGSATGTGSASPTNTTSPSGTGSPSSSATPTETETSSTPPAPTGATGDHLTVDLGKQYTVSAPAGSFAADELVNGEIHSTPLPLTETATATTDGSASYSFTVPTELSPGEHTLVLTGAGSAKTFTIPLTVRAAANNQPFQPLTNWVSDNAGTPGGMAGLFLILVLLSAAVVLGWRFYLRRPIIRRKH